LSSVLPRYVYLLLFALLLPTAALSQEGATVSGRAVDAATGAAVGLATVVVQSAESGDTLSGTLARADGRFLLRVMAPGRYTIHASSPGFFPAEVSVLVSPLNASYDLGDLRLARLDDLEEITVRSTAKASPRSTRTTWRRRWPRSGCGSDSSLSEATRITSGASH
jgi:hypothetical protein